MTDIEWTALTFFLKCRLEVDIYYFIEISGQIGVKFGTDNHGPQIKGTGSRVSKGPLTPKLYPTLTFF